MSADSLKTEIEPTIEKSCTKHTSHKAQCSEYLWCNEWTILSNV